MTSGAARRPGSMLIVTEFITLDGTVEAPGGEAGHPHSGWVFDHMGEEQQQFKLRETLDADTLLLGRTTYEGFAAAWPERDGEFADKMNGMPKVVVSSTLTDPAWENTRVVGSLDAVRDLKGTTLVAGSATLVRSLLAAGLVDVLRLMVFPVAIGGGLSIWPDDRSKLALRPVDATTFPSGVTVTDYVPA